MAVKIETQIENARRRASRAQVQMENELREVVRLRTLMSVGANANFYQQNVGAMAELKRRYTLMHESAQKEEAASRSAAPAE